MTGTSGTTLLPPPYGADPDTDARATTTIPGSPLPEAATPDPREPQPGASSTVRTILVTLGCATLAFAFYLTFGTALQHHAAQAGRFAHFRGKLAKGIAPVSPVDAKGRLLPLGTPIAVLRIPSLRMREIVGEGTTSAVLTSGPGHLRSTVFPGGAGTSVIFGRAAAYGGPFHAISHLRRGTHIDVTTGVGDATFRVVDVRHAGDKIPALPTGGARLTLVTASGRPFAPSGVLFVDADKVGTPLNAAAPPMQSVPAGEQPMGIDTSSVFALVLWLEALLAVVAGAVWAWHRRGPAHAWLLFCAPVALAATEVAAQITHLLPNLL